MARAAGGRDSVEVRDMDGGWLGAESAVAPGKDAISGACAACASRNTAGSIEKVSLNSSAGRSTHSTLTVSTPTPIMFSVRSALTNVPRVSRLTARPVVARAYHENVISHYERPRNVRSGP